MVHKKEGYHDITCLLSSTYIPNQCRDSRRIVSGLYVILSSCVLALLLLPFSGVHGEIIELTDATFEQLTQASTSGKTTKNNNKWFVNFYAPWCGHCKQLMPTWIDLDEHLQKEEKGHVILAKMDMTLSMITRDRLSISGFPTLKLFNKGHMYDYRGARTVEAMSEFVFGGYKNIPKDRKQVVPAVPSAPSWVQSKMEELRKFAKGNKTISYLITDLEHITKMRKNAALLVFAVGLLVGMWLGFLLAGKGISRCRERARNDKGIDKAKTE